MLILTRKVGGALVIGDSITKETDRAQAINVHVLGIDGNKVRIGVDAPENIKVLRDELMVKQEGK